MGYLAKLIERATDTSLDLENNQIGNYRIIPQHGINVAVYIIYKINARPTYSKRIHFGESHFMTIDIASPELRLWVNETYVTERELKEVKQILGEIYQGWRIVIEKE